MVMREVEDGDEEEEEPYITFKQWTTVEMKCCTFLGKSSILNVFVRAELKFIIAKNLFFISIYGKKKYAIPSKCCIFSFSVLKFQMLQCEMLHFSLLHF